jgi:hypothetical protein
MADRFLLLDYLTRTVVTELAAVDSFSYTETLNKPGSWSATIPLSGTVGAADLYSSRAIFAFERAEILRWAGPLLTARVDLNAGTVAISGEGYMNYLRRRVLYDTKTYAATDQLLIVKDLIDYAQTHWGAPGNLGIVTTALTAITTFARDRTYFYYEKKLIGELIEQLAAVRNGFDFRLTPRWTNGPNSTMALDFGVTYPAFGRETGYVVDVNAHNLTAVDVDLTKLAFAVTASGQGTGEDIPSSSVSNAALIAVNAVLEDAITVGDVTQTGTLVDYANRRLDLGSVPLIYPTFAFTATDIGTFIPGDQVIVVGKSGALDIGGIYRIAEQKFDLPANGPESLQLTLAPLRAWSQ